MTNDMNREPKATETIAEEARKAGETIRNEARELADETSRKTRTQAEKQFEKGQDVVASHVDTISSAIDDAATTLNAEDHPLGHYTRELADSIAGLSTKISNSSLDELANDTRRLARENPALFLLGGIAIGVAASRFFKATSERDSGDYVGGHDSNHGGSDHRYGEHRTHEQNHYMQSAYGRNPSGFSEGHTHAPGSGTGRPASSETVAPGTSQRPVSPDKKDASTKTIVESEEA